MDRILQSVEPKLLSENLLKAREICGKSIKEVSTIIGIPSSRLKNYEQGKFIPSLPELESLSYLYRIPLFAILEKDHINSFNHDPEEEQIQKLIEIRQQLIGTHIQLAREKKNLSYKKLSELSGLSSSKIKRYESGTTPIPIDDLIKINHTLNLDFSEIEDINSPIGKWQAKQVMELKRSQIPETISNFIEDPKNEKYISIASEISEIGIQKLHDLANSLLKITELKPAENNDAQE